MENTSLHNAVVSVFAASPAWVFAMIEKNDLAIISAIVLPIAFFFIGKAIDIALQIVLYKRKHKDDKE